MTMINWHRTTIKPSGGPKVRKLKAKIVTARKPHTLHCGCSIKPGQQYTQIAALVNGHFFYEKHHVARLCIETLH